MNEIEIQVETKEKKILSTKNAIVINKSGIKQEFVVVNLYDDDTEKIYMYDLKEGESLIYENVAEALSMYKAKWTGEKWIETATKEEIEEMKPTPLPPVSPSQFEFMLAEITMAMAEMQSNSQEAIAELTTVLAAIQQSILKK